jgi:hypothetical protein
MTETPSEAAEALAEHHAWSNAAEVMEHFVEAARLLGNEKLTRVMERAEALREMGRTMDALEAREE